MHLATYHKAHWAEIEAKRFGRYEEMCVWRSEGAALLAPARLEAGHTGLDFGCGPGYVALELGRRVGERGRVERCYAYSDRPYASDTRPGGQL